MIFIPFQLYKIQPIQIKGAKYLSTSCCVRKRMPYYDNKYLAPYIDKDLISVGGIVLLLCIDDDTKKKQADVFSYTYLRKF